MTVFELGLICKMKLTMLNNQLFFVLEKWKLVYSLVFIAIICFGCKKEANVKSNAKNNEVAIAKKNEITISDNLNYKNYQISHFRNGSRELKTRQGRSETSDLKWVLDDQQMRKLNNVIELNVLDYFDLYDNFTSDLQVKVFKQSDDFKDMERKLEAIREDVYSSVYFIDWKLSKYEQITEFDVVNGKHIPRKEMRRISKIPYFDVDHNSFVIIKNDVKSSLIGKFDAITGQTSINNNFLRFDDIIFDKPENIRIVNRKQTYEIKKTSERYILSGRGPETIDYMVIEFDQMLYLPFNDLNKALTVEEHSEDINVLLTFRFIKKDGGTYKLVTKLNKIVIYNGKSGEVFQVYEVS